MSAEQYIEKKFRAASVAQITQASEIMAEYQAAGYSLTLRQLYYQFVSRGLFANSIKNYKNLGSLINDARLAGLLDWDEIEDRTRNLVMRSSWSCPSDLLKAAANQYHVDMWADQPCRVEVWIEKDALVGVIEGVCNKWDVPYFACRGYSSQSEQWRAGHRFSDYIDGGQEVILLHLGDHDPSGVDMTRDNLDRLNVFIGGNALSVDELEMFEVRRLALNMNQVEQYQPPPNPAKLTDTRCHDYIAKFGNESWELDALDPMVIGQLIDDEISSIVDHDLFNDRQRIEDAGKKQLFEIAGTLQGRGASP